MTPEEQRKAALNIIKPYLSDTLTPTGIRQLGVLIISLKDVIEAALSAPAVPNWRPIETAPVGSNEKKDSHFIAINKWGSVSRCYRIFMLDQAHTICTALGIMNTGSILPRLVGCRYHHRSLLMR